MWKVLEHNFVLLVLILRKVRTWHGCKYQYKKNFFAQGIGINKEFSSKTDTVFKVSFPHHFSAVGLCLTVWLNVVSWLWKAMVKEYLGIHGYWRSAYCESCCFASEMGDSSLEHTDMHRKTNSGNIFYFFSIYLPFATFMSPKDLHTFPIIIIVIIFFLLKSRIPSEVSAQAPR